LIGAVRRSTIVFNESDSMKVVLQVVSGSSAGRRIQLRDGQTAQFGRTELADFSFSDDTRMADIQFLLVCERDRCELRDANEQPTTSVNGEPVGDESVLLESGDQITAGSTTFQALIEGMIATAAADMASESADGEETIEQDAAPNGQELVDYLELGDKADELASEQQSGDELLAALKDAAQLAAAIRLQSHLLENREAVWWGHAVVSKLGSNQLSPVESRALDAAERWVADPIQPACHAAEAAAEEASFDTAAAWIANGAFWSGETLSGEAMAPVTPDDRLTGKAVTAAILTAVYQYAPDKANDTFVECLDLASTLELPQTTPAS